MFLYAVGSDGKLYWYRNTGWLDGADPGSRKVVGQGGWDAYKSVFATSSGIIYAVGNDGKLYWYRNTGWLDGADPGSRKVVSQGGWDAYKSVFAFGAPIGANFTYDAAINTQDQQTLLNEHLFAHGQIMGCNNLTIDERRALNSAYERGIIHGINNTPNVNASAIIGGNRLFVNFQVLFPQGQQEIRQTLIHEMMHIAGYNHPNRCDAVNLPNCPQIDRPFDNGQYFGTAPLRAELCIAGSQSLTDDNGPGRDCIREGDMYSMALLHE